MLETALMGNPQYLEEIGTVTKNDKSQWSKTQGFWGETLGLEIG